MRSIELSFQEYKDSLMAHGTLLEFLYDTQSLLCQKYGLEINDTLRQQLKGPIIALGGFSGVGKDTLGLGLQTLFREFLDMDLPIYGAGSFMRSYARELGYEEANLDEFLNEIKENEEFAKEVDFHIDAATLTDAITKQKGSFIGRMAPFAIGGFGFTIWLRTDLQVIASRLTSDSKRAEFGLSYEEVLRKVQNRDHADRIRLERIYKVNLDDLIRKVDLVLDNTESVIKNTIHQAYTAVITHYNL